MDEADFAEKSVHLYQIVRRHILSYRSFNNYQIHWLELVVRTAPMWVTPPHVNHPPPLLPRTFPLLFRRVHLAFPSSFIHNDHTKVAEDNMIIFAGDKRFGIDGSRHGEGGGAFGGE